MKTSTPEWKYNGWFVYTPVSKDLGQFIEKQYRKFLENRGYNSQETWLYGNRYIAVRFRISRPSHCIIYCDPPHIDGSDCNMNHNWIGEYDKIGFTSSDIVRTSAKYNYIRISLCLLIMLIKNMILVFVYKRFYQ